MPGPFLVPELLLLLEEEEEDEPFCQQTACVSRVLDVLTKRYHTGVFLLLMVAKGFVHPFPGCTTDKTSNVICLQVTNGSVLDRVRAGLSTAVMADQKKQGKAKGAPSSALTPDECPHSPYPVDAECRRAMPYLFMALHTTTEAVFEMVSGEPECLARGMALLLQASRDVPDVFRDPKMPARCFGLCVEAYLNHDFPEALKFWGVAAVLHVIQNIKGANMPPLSAGGPFSKVEVFMQSFLAIVLDDGNPEAPYITPWGTPVIRWPKNWEFPPLEQRPCPQFGALMKRGLTEARMLVALQEMVPCSCLDAEDPRKQGASRPVQDRTVHVLDPFGRMSAPKVKKKASYYVADCEACGRVAKLSRCSNCRLVSYCSKV